MAESYIIKIQGADSALKKVYYEVDLALPPIGEGGMGRVFRGVQVNESTGVRRDVAVKFLKEGLPASMIERAKREASIRLHHDNLVEMIDFVEMGQNDGYGNNIVRLHVVSELLKGVLLADMLQGQCADADGQTVPYASELYRLYNDDRKSFVISMGKKITSAIMALHDAGYIHRDIDPSNIMVTTDGKVKVIDFGIARSIHQLKNEPSTTRVGNFLGKPEYAAPELIHGDLRHQNATTDIYALGVLIFQLLTGHLPFEGPTQDVMDMQCNADLPIHEIEDPSLRAIIEKATQKQQSLRYQSAAEFRVALEKAQAVGGNDDDNDNDDDCSALPLGSSKNENDGSGSTGFNPYGTQIWENNGNASDPKEQTSNGTTQTGSYTSNHAADFMGLPLWTWITSAVAGLGIGITLAFAF